MPQSSLAVKDDRTFFDIYFDYVGTTESPALYHRWTALSILGALLGRNVYYPFGHNNIYPNQYILLTGTPAARKGTAIKIGKNLLFKLGYAHIAPNKAAKEAFWGWMAKKHDVEPEGKTIEEQIDYLFEIDNPKNKITEAYIAHDEFLDFIGSGDTDFVTNLTNLWDNLPEFINPKTRGDDIYIPNPTVNILSGITPAGISDSFKSLALGGGFFSRMLFVYSTPSGRKITFPSRPCPAHEDLLLSHLTEITQLSGELHLTKEVEHLLDRIYQSSPGMSDPRFQYYTERRLTHLIKMLIIISASKLTLTPTTQDLLLANTILYNTELNMSKALGEYGKSRNSEIANTIITALNQSKHPLSLREIGKLVGRDLNKYSDLLEIMGSLVQQERIIRSTGTKGSKEAVYLPNNLTSMTWSEDLIDFNLLRDEEHNQ